MHEATVKTKFCENLKKENSRQHFAFIERTTEKLKEKEFTNSLIKKFEKLKKGLGEKSEQKKTSYIEKVCINVTNTELIEEQKSMLNLGPSFIPATKKNAVY